MTSKAQTRRDALAAWWDRKPWPCIICAADPGAESGYCVLKSTGTGIDVLDCGTVADVFTTEDVRRVVLETNNAAFAHKLPVVYVLEDWGSGGPLGINQWVGLGEARGVWRHYITLEHSEAFEKSPKIVKVTQSRWRSRVVEETGRVDANGKWHRFSPDDWKGAALRAAKQHFIDTHIPPLDAAEAACIGYYAARSDEVMKALGIRHLRKHAPWFVGSLKENLLEPLIKR